MVHIKKGPEPHALTQAKHGGLRHYDNMESITRDAIKESLLEEQYHLCAYCMRRIDLSSMQIEHYVAQNPQNGQTTPELTIDYNNMLGVCSGGKNEVHTLKYLTCDQHRGNIPLTVNPLNAISVAQIKYRADGEIYSDNPEINKDLCETLNLNCEAARLKENRKSALDAVKNWVKQKYNGKAVSSADWTRIHTYLCSPKSGVKREYVGILDFYLGKKSKSTK